MTFDRLTIAKTAICWITAGGAANIARQIIDNNIDEPETLIDKIKVVAGTMAVGSMVGAQVRRYTDETLDEMIAFAKEFKKDEATATK